MATNKGPLAGIRVLELGQLMAGPMAGTYLAYFGADVIKVERPGDGDPVRGWRVVDEGTSLWWRSLGRNKRLVTAELRSEAGRDVVRRLAAKCDVVIENFRPGTMESWGLGPDDLRKGNPGLIYTRVSGFGQDGPNASRGGFASVCEAFGGLRYVTGHPGETPVRSNLSIGDSLAAFQALIGVLLALVRRERDAGGRGQVVDVAIYEAVYNLMEGAVPEYDRCGVVREPSGTTITGVVPTDAYPCSDGKRVVIGANGDSIFRRLMETAGRADMASAERLATNEKRMVHQAEIDEAIAAWTSTLPSADVVAALNDARVPGGPIYSVADMLDDAHYQARGMFEEVEVGGRPVKLPALGPKLGETPGGTRWPGGDVGSHTEEVLSEVLGMGSSDIDALRDSGAV